MSKRIKLAELSRDRFYMTPKELLLNPRYRKILSSDARMAYSVLKDRLELSRKNNWVNDKGEVYLKFKREKLGALLDISINTVTKVMKQLRHACLIEEEIVGCGNVNMIYICHMQEATKEQIEEFEKEYHEDLEEIGADNLESLERELTHKICEPRITNFGILGSQTLGVTKSSLIPTDKTVIGQDFSSSDTYTSDTYLNDKTTTTEDSPINGKDINVEQVKQDIEKILNQKIKSSSVKKLLCECGEERVYFYIKNWNKFKCTNKNNVVGFFLDAVKENYNLPEKEVSMCNKSNFDQREYTAEDFEKFYFKVKE